MPLQRRRRDPRPVRGRQRARLRARDEPLCRRRRARRSRALASCRRGRFTVATRSDAGSATGSRPSTATLRFDIQRDHRAPGRLVPDRRRRRRARRGRAERRGDRRSSGSTACATERSSTSRTSRRATRRSRDDEDRRSSRSGSRAARRPSRATGATPSTELGHESFILARPGSGPRAGGSEVDDPVWDAPGVTHASQQEVPTRRVRALGIRQRARRGVLRQRIRVRRDPRRTARQRRAHGRPLRLGALLRG